MPTTRRSPRRRVLLLNRLEDRAPGQIAFAFHLTRSRSRTGAIRSYAFLGDWARHRQALLDDERRPGDQFGGEPGPAEHRFDGGDPRSPEPSATYNESANPERPAHEDTPTPLRADTPPNIDDDVAGVSERPNSEWTKGRLYDMARRFELAGRSKLNKADLLDAVVAEWERRRSAGDAGPNTSASG